MKVIRHSLCIRGFIAALMLASWLVLTNHCALAGLPASARASDGAPSCCHREEAPLPAGDACPQTLQCCKTAKAALPEKVSLAGDESFSECPADLVEGGVLRPVRPCSVVVPRDHGPPRALSFAELVLQQSLLSHAPPFAA